MSQLEGKARKASRYLTQTINCESLGEEKKVFLHFLSRSMIYLLQIYYFKVRRHFSSKLTRRFKICIAFFIVFQYFKDSLTSTDFILLLKENNAHRLWELCWLVQRVQEINLCVYFRILLNLEKCTKVSTLG